MGKKHKESKGREKRQKQARSPEKVTPAVVAPGSHPSEEDEPPVDAVIDVEDDPPVDAVIDLEEDLDDPEARAELIAAAAALAAEGPSTAADGEATGEEVTVEGGASGDIEWSGDPDSDAEYGPTPSDGPDADAPLIGPDSLVALSEFRREGVATLPEELILDLGDATSPEERDRLLAAALAHVEMQDAIYRVQTESGASRRWKGLIASAVFLMAVFLAGLPPAFLVPDAPPPLTASETARGLRMTLLMQAEQIEAFRARSDRLPTSLSEVDTALPGVRFVRSSNRLYQLIVYTPDGDAVVYDSASPDPAFAAASAAWARLRGDS